MINLKRILVPIDFSPHSVKATTYAAALAEKFEAEILLVHVLQDMAMLLPDPGTAAIALVPPKDKLIDPAREALARIATEAGLHRFKLREEVRQGVPYAEIVELAREASVDLIVLGTHGRSGLAHMFLGSVAERVVRIAPCPVLTVHLDEHEFLQP